MSSCQLPGRKRSTIIYLIMMMVTEQEASYRGKKNSYMITCLLCFLKKK